MIRDAVVLGILPLENRELGAKLSLQAFSTELFLFSDNRVAPGNIKFLARSGFPGGISQANAIFGFFFALASHCSGIVCDVVARGRKIRHSTHHQLSKGRFCLVTFPLCCRRKALHSK